jgi:hypothetical protein
MSYYNEKERDRLLNFLDKLQAEQDREFEHLKQYAVDIKSERSKIEEAHSLKKDNKDEEESENDEDDSSDHRDHKKEEQNILSIIEKLCVDAKYSKKVPETILSFIKNKEGNSKVVDGLRKLLETKGKTKPQTLLSQIAQSIRNELLPENIRTLEDFRGFVQDVVKMQRDLQMDRTKRVSSEISKESLKQKQVQEIKEERNVDIEEKKPNKEDKELSEVSKRKKSFVEKVAQSRESAGKSV